MKMNHREEKNWQWIKDRLGYVCAVPGCGCTEDLELDHIDPRLELSCCLQSPLACLCHHRD